MRLACVAMRPLTLKSARLTATVNFRLVVQERVKVTNQIHGRLGFNILQYVDLNKPSEMAKTCNSDWLNFKIQYALSDNRAKVNSVQMCSCRHYF